LPVLRGPANLFLFTCSMRSSTSIHASSPLQQPPGCHRRRPLVQLRCYLPSRRQAEMISARAARRRRVASS
jgi:hypothetical protein